GDNSRDPYANPPGRGGSRSGGYNDYNNDYGARGYRNEPNRPGYNDGGYSDRSYQPRRSDGVYNDYGDRTRRPDYNDPNPPASYPPRREPPRTPRGGRDNYPPQESYNSRNAPRNAPYENDWDDDDDEWF
ncbi:MAG: molecular chaperone DnaK, partial [Pleurocapsa sp.]